jgi:hypothetical protein
MGKRDGQNAGELSERDKDEIASGSNVVSYDAKMQRREAEKQQNVFDATYDAALKRGASQEQASAAADQAVTDSGIGSVTPALDRYSADMRKLKQSREAEAQAEKTRLLKDSLNKFQSDLSKSMTFGEESALLTPEGRQRALKAAVKSGYSFDEADAMVQGAFKKLQEIGKRDKVPTVIPPPPARPEDKDTATAAEPTPVTTPVQPEIEQPKQRDTSPDASASASHKARQRGRADAGKPTEVIPENMGNPTGPPIPGTAIPVKNALGTVWVDSSGYTYPYKPAPINPEDYTSGAELLDMVGLPKAWSDLKSSASNVAQGFKEEYNKAKKESPSTPLRSAAKGAWEALGRATPNKEWWFKGL